VPESIANAAILALTHVGLALVLVLAGFAVISRAFAYGGRTPQFEIASGVLIAVIGGFLLWRSLIRDHHARSKDGKALAFVTGMIPCPLTTFIMGHALARGMLGARLAVTAAMTVGMIAPSAGSPWPLRLHEIAFWECSTAPKYGGAVRERCCR
jgi:nickel/cobalt transporter (NicO) family protein